MFNKKEFKRLLEKAMGDRTQTEYAEASGVNRTYISKYINLKLDDPPSPEIIRRLAEKSFNNDVAYEDLMHIAGHIFKKADAEKANQVDDQSLALDKTQSVLSQVITQLRNESAFTEQEKQWLEEDAAYFLRYMMIQRKLAKAKQKQD